MPGFQSLQTNSESGIISVPWRAIFEGAVKNTTVPTLQNLPIARAARDRSAPSPPGFPPPTPPGFPPALTAGCIPPVPPALPNGLPLALARGLHPNCASPALPHGFPAGLGRRLHPNCASPALPNGLPAGLGRRLHPNCASPALPNGLPLALARGLHPNCATRATQPNNLSPTLPVTCGFTPQPRTPTPCLPSLRSTNHVTSNHHRQTQTAAVR
jgi:hypothetical protein